MATVTATKNGNWSDTSVWDTGVVPVNGDSVKAVSYTITFDVDVNQPQTVLEATSGKFVHSGTGTRTVVANANVGNHSTNGGLIQNTSSGALIFDGEVKSSSATNANAYGAANNATGTLTVTTAIGVNTSGAWCFGAYNASTGTLNVGTATGGNGNYSTIDRGAHGAVNASTGTLNVTTANGGGSSGVNSYGVYSLGNGVVNVTTANGGAGTSCHGVNNVANNCTVSVMTAVGGTGTNCYGAVNSPAGSAGTALMVVDIAVGNAVGPGVTGNMNAGVFGSNSAIAVTRVKAIQYGAYGSSPTAGAVLLDATATQTAQFRTANNGATLTLTNPAQTADFPTTANVRAGTVYANGNLTGTLAVPAANQVAVGIAVDATTGTAVLTQANAAAAVWNATRASYTTDGTFGDVAEWAGSVDTGAIADAVCDEVLEGTLTIRQAMRVMLAALANKSNGGGTASITFRDLADTKARISATVDANGNRTAVTVDGS